MHARDLVWTLTQGLIVITSKHYLPDGLPIPAPEQDSLSAPYWEGLQRERLRVQRCRQCAQVQWGPEWICHRCHAFDLAWKDVEPRGQIYSWERVWHAVHPALKNAVPYLVVLVELASHPEVRLIGNLLGDPLQSIAIGQAVVGVFEHHVTSNPAYSLLHWRVA
jgi:uncharacterized OB-fold protein